MVKIHIFRSSRLYTGHPVHTGSFQNLRRVVFKYFIEFCNTLKKTIYKKNRVVDSDHDSIKYTTGFVNKKKVTPDPYGFLTCGYFLTSVISKPVCELIISSV